jgi:hypothetical protein
LAEADEMDVAGIGVQTITPTTGTAAQNPNPAPQQPADRADTQRSKAPPAPGTGEIIDRDV